MYKEIIDAAVKWWSEAIMDAQKYSNTDELPMIVAMFGDDERKHRLTEKEMETFRKDLADRLEQKMKSEDWECIELSVDCHGPDQILRDAGRTIKLMPLNFPRFAIMQITKTRITASRHSRNISQIIWKADTD